MTEGGVDILDATKLNEKTSLMKGVSDDNIELGNIDLKKIYPPGDDDKVIDFADTSTSTRSESADEQEISFWDLKELLLKIICQKLIENSRKKFPLTYLTEIKSYLRCKTDLG